MSFKSLMMAALIAVVPATAAMAEDIMLHDAYARASMPNAKAGAAFMMIHNTGTEDDHLLSVSSPVAKKVQLHTHIEDDNGVMQMMHVEDGFALPAGGMIMLERGGNHVMFMGLTESFDHGKSIPLTLVFEKAGEIAVDIPVDLERKAGEGHSHSHQSN